MQDATNPYRSWGLPAVQAPADERASFIRLTYIHLAAAVFGLMAIDAVLLSMPMTGQLVQSMGQTAWIALMFGFMGASWLATYWANSATSVAKQYLGLTMYVVIQALIMLPILWYANNFVPGAIASAGLITAVVFGGLTMIVFVTGADFSFLRTTLMVAGFATLGIIIAGYFFGWNLGVFFSGFVILLACGYILYHTSNVMLHYRIGQHVAAALALFASVALLFIYVLRLVMALNSRR